MYGWQSCKVHLKKVLKHLVLNLLTFSPFFSNAASFLPLPNLSHVHFLFLHFSPWEKCNMFSPGLGRVSEKQSHKSTGNGTFPIPRVTARTLVTLRIRSPSIWSPLSTKKLLLKRGCLQWKESRDSLRPNAAAEDEGKVLSPKNALVTPGTACTSSCHGPGCPPTPFTLLGKYSRHISSGSKHFFFFLNLSALQVRSSTYKPNCALSASSIIAVHKGGEAEPS